MKVTPEHLDRLRAELLARHRVRPEAATAFDLARAAYMAGDYDQALGFFREAHERAPHDPGAALSLARAANALGHPDLESAAVARGLSSVPDHPPLVLHAALRQVPGDIAQAMRMLQRVRNDPLCAEFLVALEHVSASLPVPLPPDGEPRAVSRALGARWLQARAPGPGTFHGLPASVLRHALAEASVAGLVLEFGVYHGRSLRLIAAASPGEVHGFDSFSGLPEAWNADEGPGSYSTGGRLPAVAANVRLHRGWFEDVLPPFVERHAGPVRFLHVDCDLYSSTRTVLDGLRDRLVPGSVIVFDDLLGYPGYAEHELRAFDEFIAHTGQQYEVIAGALLGREVAVRLTA